VLRVHSDPLVGPVISFGLAGLFSDLFEDVATAVTPLTDRDASALLASLRAYPLLTGAAGDRAADRPAVSGTRCCGCRRWSRTYRRFSRSPSTRWSSADLGKASPPSPRPCVSANPARRGWPR
jgi:ATP-grasp domain